MLHIYSIECPHIKTTRYTKLSLIVLWYNKQMMFVIKKESSSLIESSQDACIGSIVLIIIINKILVVKLKDLFVEMR